MTMTIQKEKELRYLNKILILKKVRNLYVIILQKEHIYIKKKAICEVI